MADADVRSYLVKTGDESSGPGRVRLIGLAEGTAKHALLGVDPPGVGEKHQPGDDERGEPVVEGETRSDPHPDAPAVPGLADPPIRSHPHPRLTAVRPNPS